MDGIDMETLIDSLIRHEKRVPKIYLDSQGFVTGGIGHHFWPGSRLPDEAIDALFRQDVADALASFRSIPPVKRNQLNEARRRVIVEMLFNMNLQKVLKFVKMWEAIEQRDFEQAAYEMLDSKWRTQVGQRAEELAEIMRKGE